MVTHRRQVASTAVGSVVSVVRQNGTVPVGVTVSYTLPDGSVVDVTVAAPSGASCGRVQPLVPSATRRSRSLAPALMHTVDVPVSAGLWVMVTTPDGQPTGTGVVGMAVSVGVPVMCTGVTIGPGLAGTAETEPGVQDATATDSKTHTAASRARLSLSITPLAWIAAPRAASRCREGSLAVEDRFHDRAGAAGGAAVVLLEGLGGVAGRVAEQAGDRGQLAVLGRQRVAGASADQHDRVPDPRGQIPGRHQGGRVVGGQQAGLNRRGHRLAGPGGLQPGHGVGVP